MDKPASNLHFKVMAFAFKLRDFFLPRKNTLKEAGIKPGGHVLDYGCGPGSYTITVAELVGGSGKFYALDIHPLAIQMVRDIASKKYLKMKLEIRKAASSDIKDIKTILSFYYLDTEKVEKNLPEFIVAVLDKKIAGCACLDVGDIIELRSIAVLPARRNKGIGSKLVDAVLSRARELTDTVYLRTTSPVFFEKKGFRRLPNDQKKVLWKECAECDRFNVCAQALMKINFEKAHQIN